MDNNEFVNNASAPVEVQPDPVVADQQAAPEAPQKPVKQKKKGFVFSLIGFICSILALMESTFPIGYKFILNLEEAAVKGMSSGYKTYYLDTTFADALSTVFTWSMYALAAIGCILCIVGMIMFFASKNKKDNKATLILAIIGIILGILAVCGLFISTAIAENMTSVIF